VTLIDGLRIAQKLGNVRVSGTVLLGALSALLAIAPALWEEVIGERVPSRYVEVNRQAFQAGRSEV
jgi:indolepyruvate ferredoxin oxidoreductase beta subunit